MKLYLTIPFVLLHLISFCQEIPDDINNRLEGIRQAAQTRLLNYRISNEGRLVRGHRLSSEFPHADRQRIDSLGLKVDIQLIYDQSMRERVLQLLLLEYSADELEELIERSLQDSEIWLKMQAIDYCKLDTLELFKKAYKEEAAKEIHFSDSELKHRLIIKLKLDTLQCFEYALNLVKNDLINIELEYYRNSGPRTNLDPIAELAGHLGDSMFIEPLISALDNPRNFPGTNAKEALVRMRVEPYYSNYIIKNTFPLEEIQKLEYLIVPLEKYLDIWRTQEGFREVSKYLFSNAASVVEVHGDRTIVTQRANQRALMLIRNNLLNQDLQELLQDVERQPPVEDDIYEILYHWMQNNYGNYEIKRIW